MNSKTLYGKYFYVLIIVVITLIFTSNTFAGSNRKSVMDTRENGWTVAWGKHIDHIEYAKISICMLDPTTTCINAYFTNLIKDSAKTLGKNIVLKALKNRGKLFSSGNIEYGAGIATYNHWGRENPCSITGGICWTPKIPKPNTHQPFVRWRTKLSSSNPISHVDVTFGDKSNVSCNAHGLSKISTDLNSGSGGKFIYLCEERVNKSVRLVDLQVTVSDNDKDHCPSGYRRDSIDLNSGSKGKFIYFCRKYASGVTPIKKIKFVLHEESADIAKQQCGNGWILRHEDLNTGSGGKFIFLCFKR